jgi:hypothetical protein
LKKNFLRLFSQGCTSLPTLGISVIQLSPSFSRELRSAISVEQGEKWKQQPEWQSIVRRSGQDMSGRAMGLRPIEKESRR